MAITALKNKALILNDITYTKEDLVTRKSSKTSFQSITIDNNQNHICYEILGYNPSWDYRVYLGGVGSLSLIQENNSKYKYEIKNNNFYLYDYDTTGPQTFLIVGVSS